MFSVRMHNVCLLLHDLCCCYHAIQIISKLEREEGEPWPSGRSAHAACCLGLGFGSQHPHLLITGGRDNDGKILGDAWLFDMTKRKWKEVSGVGYHHYNAAL